MTFCLGVAQREWAPVGDTFVTKCACVDVHFPIHADGGISGRVTTAEGKPASNAQLAILPVSP
jgi:hypothetical protein